MKILLRKTFKKEHNTVITNSLSVGEAEDLDPVHTFWIIPVIKTMSFL